MLKDGRFPVNSKKKNYKRYKVKTIEEEYRANKAVKVKQKKINISKIDIK